MRNYTFRLLAGFVVVTMLFAQGGCCVGGPVSIKQDHKDPAQWRMSNGTVELMVDGAKGRVMAYGFKGGRNILWTNAEPENPKYRLGAWTNYGGDKIWTWPQSDWGWPPIEPASYDVQMGDDGKSLQMTSAPLAGYGLRIVRLIELAPSGTQVTFTTCFKPSGNSFAKPVAAWSITQVPHPKRILVRIPLKGDRQAYLNRVPDASDKFVAKAMSDSVVSLQWTGEGGIKTFMEADVFASVFDDAIFLQHQLVAPGSDPWTPNQRAQIYCHPATAGNIPPGPSYTELEWTAPLAPPNRLDLNPLRLTWQLVETKTPLSDAQLVDIVKTAE